MKGLGLLEQARALAVEAGDRDVLGGVCDGLGLFHCLQGEYDALLARARAEHHQAAPDATSRGGVSAASAETLQDAETWLRTALALAEEHSLSG